MAYQLPTLPELLSRCRSFFGIAEPADTIRLKPNVHDQVAKVLALLSLELNQRIAFLFDQIFASRADETWLIRHGFELGITRRASSKALGTATGPATTGIVFPAGLIFVRSDGARFETTSSAVGVGGQVAFEIRAVEPGLAGNTNAGVTMTPEDALGIDDFEGPLTVTSGGLGGGAEAETIEEYRARVLARKRNPPHGGSKADWQRWALEVPGVTAAFVDTFAGDSREVWIAFLFEGRTNGIPTSGDVAVVQAYLDDDARRPVTARVSAVAPTTQAVAMTIRIEPDTAEIRDRVTAEIAAMFTDRAKPATPNSNAIFYRGWIDEAIARAVGEDNHTLSVPSADITVTTPGAIPVPGAITWT